ncbi:hypothetical protein ABW19_dt0207487 [Dactylella cylindrospora]|nr:hypothetical protein ABW19_dt0207487 [Dactylella cylindrospora]
MKRPWTISLLYVLSVQVSVSLAAPPGNTLSDSLQPGYTNPSVQFWKPPSDSRDMEILLEESKELGALFREHKAQLPPLPPILQNPLGGNYGPIRIARVDEPTMAPFPAALHLGLRSPPSEDYIYIWFKESMQIGDYEIDNPFITHFAISPKDRAISYSKRRKLQSDDSDSAVRYKYKFGMDREYIVAGWWEAKKKIPNMPFIKYVHWGERSNLAVDIDDALHSSILGYSSLEGSMDIWRRFRFSEGGRLQKSFEGMILHKYHRNEVIREAFNLFYSLPEATEVDSMVRENPAIFGPGDMEIIAVSLLTMSGSMVWEIGPRHAAPSPIGIKIE